MNDQLQEAVYAIVAAYGCVTTSFIEEQTTWFGASKDDVTRCVDDLVKKGCLTSPNPGKVQAALR